jgi:hypothetical protein
MIKKILAFRERHLQGWSAFWLIFEFYWAVVFGVYMLKYGWLY